MIKCALCGVEWSGWLEEAPSPGASKPAPSPAVRDLAVSSPSPDVRERDGVRAEAPSPHRGEGRGEGDALTGEGLPTDPVAPLLRIVEAASRQFPGYDPLAFVLVEALRQAAAGKGRERHTRDGATDASSTPFEQQPICEIPRALGSLGLGFPLGQALKKIQEASLLLERGHHAPARAELLGAIVYAASAVSLIDESSPADLAAPGVPSAPR